MLRAPVNALGYGDLKEFKNPNGLIFEALFGAIFTKN